MNSDNKPKPSAEEVVVSQNVAAAGNQVPGAEPSGDVLNEEQMRLHLLRVAEQIERRDLNGF